METLTPNSTPQILGTTQSIIPIASKPPVTPTGSTSPTVISSNAASNDLAKIQDTHATITQGMQTQAQKIAADKAVADAKAAQDAATKAVADKQAQDYQLKLAALNNDGGATPTSKTIYDSTGRAYQVDNSGQITSGPTGGQYQIGSNVSNYPELSSQINQPTTNEGVVDSSTSQLNTLTAERVAQAKKVSDQLLGIQNGAIPLSDAENAQIDSLKQQYQTMINEQIHTNAVEKGVNQLAGYRNGGAAQEYTPEIEAGRIANIVSKGTAKVADLQGKMTSAVAQLTQALKDNDMKAIQDAYNIYNDAAKDHATTLQKTISDTQAAIKDVRDYNLKVQEDAQKTAQDQKNYQLELNKFDLQKSTSIVDNQLKKAQISKIYSDMSSGDMSAASSWVTNIKNGTAKLSDVPKNLKNAVAAGLANGGSSQSDMLNTTQKSLQELQNMVDNNNGFKGAVGFKGISSFFGLKGTPVAGSAASDFDAKLKQTVNDVVLPNLTILHGLGRVTDREFQALQSAITSLNTNVSESAFKTELANIKQRIDDKINNTPDPLEIGTTKSSLSANNPLGL